MIRNQLFPNKVDPMILRRRRALLMGKPEPYTFVNYIESHGQEAIATNFVPQYPPITSSCQIAYSDYAGYGSETQRAYLFGTYTTNSWKGTLKLNAYESKWKYVEVYAGAYTGETNPRVIGSRDCIASNSKGRIVTANYPADSTLWVYRDANFNYMEAAYSGANTATSSSGGNSSAPVALFAKDCFINSSTGAVTFHTISVGFRCYYFRAWANGVLVCDMVPAIRNSDGEVGMYERIEGKFYGNGTGNGAFTYG